MERVAGRGWTVDGGVRSWSLEAAARWGGYALVAGGALGVVAGVVFLLLALGVLSHLSPGYEYYDDYYRGKRLLNAFYDLPGPVGVMLAAAGLGGLCALLPAGRRARLAAGAGWALLLASAVLTGVPGLYRALAQPMPFPYGPPEGATLYGIFSVAAPFAATGGVLVLGVAGLRARGLGRWRALPLVLGMLGAPWPYLLYPGEVLGFAVIGGLGFAVVLGSQGVVVNLGWILLGLLLVGARGRERALVEGENLALARRLYEEGWGGGDVGVIRDLAAPDVVDHHHAQHGPESLERSVAALRRSFPDLRFEVEEQAARGDAVVTRWKASGTDRGGVLWYPPTGRAATFTGVFTDRFSEGRLVEHRGESDTAGLLRQLGLPPSGR